MERNIREMVHGLRKAIDDIDGQLKAIEKSDTFRENTELAQKNAKMAEQLEKAEREREKLARDNATLKNTLYEQYFNEKVSTVNRFQHNMEIFFKETAAGEANKLNALETQIRGRLREWQRYSQQAGAEIAKDAVAEIDQLGGNIAKRIEEARKNTSSITFLEEERAEMERLRKQNITDDQITQLSSKNNVERYVGLNILNAVGILLFIVGAIAASRFGYTWVSFALGAGFLVGGEMLNRRRPNVFSLGMTAGGLAISYVSLAIGHFFHETIAMYPALGICVGITALAFYLSMRYKSQSLLTMTLVGGYLPIMSILLDAGRPDPALIYGMMGYFVLFNLLALMVALRNKWKLAAFIGLGLNLVGTWLIAINTTPEQALITLIYIVFAVMIYNIIPIISTMRTTGKLTDVDTVLVGANTLFGGLVIGMHIDWVFADFAGLASASGAALYLAASHWVARKFENAKPMQITLFTASMMLALLFVPFQSDAAWWTPAWMGLTLVLAIFSIFKAWVNYRYAAIAVATIAMLRFIGFDIYEVLWWTAAPHWTDFILQFSSIVVVGVTILTIMALRNMLYSWAQKSFKYGVIAIIWAFGLFMIGRLWDVLLAAFPASPISIEYLMYALMAVFTLLYGKFMPRIPRIGDTGARIMGVMFTFMAIIGIFALGSTTSPTTTQLTGHHTNIIILATAILIVVEMAGIYAVYDVTRQAVLKKIMGIQYLPLVVSTYIVLVFTVTLTLDFGLDFASFWISLVYIAAALLWTILGFLRRYSLLRRAGLALALFSVVKLFLFDLTLLTQGLRILSYFIMGAVLVIISFVYQYFSKRLELSIKIQKEEESN
ncbi:MAG: DUF2339 domain-containing protein [Defluviitaleaceae bacterium]|nr:DUF2339 domain-containing protein [Defluviitaleaceae bacterium]